MHNVRYSSCQLEPPSSQGDSWRCRSEDRSLSARLRSNRQRPNLHRRQASQEKRCRKALAIDLSVDLVRQFIDSELLKSARQFLVGDSSTPHRFLNDVSGLVFPVFQRSARTLPGGRHFGRHFIPVFCAQVSPVGISAGSSTIIGRIRPIRDFTLSQIPTRTHQPLLESF